MRDLDAALSIFRCPATGRHVTRVDAATVERLNDAVEQGRLETLDGEPVERPLEAALQPEDTDFAYPVRGGIPDFRLDQRVPLEV
ncbi:MAG: hypothetical protein ABEN55_15680 [Bradymonadaceae bacterium]